jgi:hypothetical protein
MPPMDLALEADFSGTPSAAMLPVELVS